MATVTIRQRLTIEMQESLVSALENGQSLKGACELVYFSYARACVLMGEKSSKGRKFSAIINRAQAVAEHRLVTRIMESGNPSDCLKFLQSRFSEWDKRGNVNTKDQANLKAESLLARMSAIPEEIKKRKS